MSRKTIHLVELYSPENEMEVLLLKSILDDSGIDFFVKNDTFGSLTVGPQIAHYNRKTILVAEDQLDDAREVLVEFLEKTSHRPHAPYRLRDKLRMIFEVLLFGWIMPGRRRSSPPRLELLDGAGDDGASRPDRRPKRPRLRVIRGGGARGAGRTPPR